MYNQLCNHFRHFRCERKRRDKTHSMKQVCLKLEHHHHLSNPVNLFLPFSRLTATCCMSLLRACWFYESCSLSHRRGCLSSLIPHQSHVWLSVSPDWLEKIVCTSRIPSLKDEEDDDVCIAKKEEMTRMVMPMMEMRLALSLAASLETQSKRRQDTSLSSVSRSLSSSQFVELPNHPLSSSAFVSHQLPTILC